MKKLYGLLSMFGLFEAVARYLGHRVPNSRIVKSLCYHVGEALYERGDTAPHIARLINGPLLNVDFRDRGPRSIYFFGTWEPDVTRIIQHLAKPGQIWIDAGANIGFFTILLSSIVGPAGRILAFEPNPVVADYISDSLRLNDTTNTTLVRAAVAEESGRDVILHVPANNCETAGGSGRASLVPQGDITDTREVKVKTIALDQYIRDENIKVDFMKIDIEGYEYSALEGMKQTLMVNPPLVIIAEANHLIDCMMPPREFISYVSTYGYVPFRIREKGLFSYQDGDDLDPIKDNNIAFIQPSAYHLIALLVVK